MTTVAALKAKQLLRTPADRTLLVQKAFVRRLKAATGVKALVSTRIYDRPPQGVTFPYLTMGDTISLPFDAEDMRGQEMDIQVHTWSRKPGAAECRQIMAQVGDALHWCDLGLDAGDQVLCRLVSSRTMGDPDGITTHGIQNFTVITSS